MSDDNDTDPVRDGEATDRTRTAGDGDPTRRRFVRLAGATGATTLLSGRAFAAQDDEGERGESGDGGGDDRSGRDDDGSGDGDDEGLVTVQSGASVAETVDRIQTAIEDAEGVTLVATVDHAENAASVGKELRPTTLLVFGNPELGTELMQADQTAGIDLPQKMLVWEGADGATYVTYNDPEYVADRHDIDDEQDVLSTISGALRQFAEAGVEGN